MKSKTRIGLSGILGIGGATAIAVATGGAAIPLVLLAATGATMKKIASEPDYEPTYKPDFSVSNISRNAGVTKLVEMGWNKLSEIEDNRRNYNLNLSIGADLAEQQLSNLSQSEYEKVSKVSIFPEARGRVLGLRIGRKTMEVELEYE